MSYRPADERYSNMVYRRCGRSGLKLPAVSLGLWHNFGEDTPHRTKREICRTAFDHGITHFDLANNYGPPPGSAETAFGEILRTDFAGYRAHARIVPETTSLFFILARHSCMIFSRPAPPTPGIPMRITFSAEELAFRDEARDFFQNELPEDLTRKQHLGIPLERDDYIAFQKALFGKGWAGYNWPVEYGGTGWTAVQKYIFGAEMANANAPGIIPFGLGMVGPIIYTYGTEEQKQRFLPDILESNV